MSPPSGRFASVGVVFCGIRNNLYLCWDKTHGELFRLEIDGKNVARDFFHFYFKLWFYYILYVLEIRNLFRKTHSWKRMK